MIDTNRIEEIKMMPVTKAKAAMKEYAAELGVVIKAKTIDNMVSEMGAQLAERHHYDNSNPRSAIQPRVKGVAVLPARLEPLKGHSFTLYAKPTDINDIDKCTFQWSFKKANTADFVDLVGATKQRYICTNVVDNNVGEYKCKITEPNGTETVSSTAAHVGTLTTLPKDFPLMNLYNAQWSDFYGRSFAHVGWHSISKMIQILNGDNADSPSDTHTEMSMHKASVPLLHLISNTSELIATDSRDGYRWLISAANDKTTKLTEYGRFIK